MGGGGGNKGMTVVGKILIFQRDVPRRRAGCTGVGLTLQSTKADGRGKGAKVNQFTSILAGGQAKKNPYSCYVRK